MNTNISYTYQLNILLKILYSYKLIKRTYKKSMILLGKKISFLTW